MRGNPREATLAGAPSGRGPALRESTTPRATWRSARLGICGPVAFATLLGCSNAPVESSASDDCIGDLHASFRLMAESDAGYRDSLERLGATAIAAAQEEALRTAREGRVSCRDILLTWLYTFRPNHIGASDGPAPALYLGLDVATAPPEDPRSPSFEILSEGAALLRVPSFERPYREPLLALIERHRSEIESRDSLIIDVRGNGGGSDSTYDSLGAIAYTQPVFFRGMDRLSSPDNIRILELQGQNLGDLDEEELSALRARPGEFVSTGEDASFERQPSWPRPTRIAVLMDIGCGSSCEQFLLEVRQSTKVTLIGQRSLGSLDYSNMMAHPLPSGRRTLFLASTRSRRLPQEPVDTTGILPEVELDPTRFDGPRRREALDEVLAIIAQR